MKEVIDGLLYDTEESELLWQGNRVFAAVDGVGMPARVSFYRTKNGHFFETIIYLGEKNFFWKCLTGNWHDSEPYFYPLTQERTKERLFKIGVDLTKLGLGGFQKA